MSDDDERAVVAYLVKKNFKIPLNNPRYKQKHLAARTKAFKKYRRDGMIRSSSWSIEEQLKRWYELIENWEADRDKEGGNSIIQRESMSGCFVSVGLKKDPVTDKYVTFSHSKCGTISTLHREVKQLEDTVDKSNFCVGDEAMQFDTTQRPKDPDEEEEDVLAAAAEESESDSDQDDE